jgi:hypothetical protein
MLHPKDTSVSTLDRTPVRAGWLACLGTSKFARTAIGRTCVSLRACRRILRLNHAQGHDGVARRCTASLQAESRSYAWADGFRRLLKQAHSTERAARSHSLHLTMDINLCGIRPAPFVCPGELRGMVRECPAAYNALQERSGPSQLLLPVARLLRPLRIYVALQPGDFC